MQYRDEDEESNLFYQKYQKAKNINGVIKAKNTKGNIQVKDNQPSSTIPNTLINKKRERHDSSSEENNNSDSDNSEYKPQIITSNDNDNKPIIPKPSIKTIEFTMKSIDNSIIPLDVQEQLFTSKNIHKEKKKRIEENYDNLALWAKGIIQLEEREKKREEKDVIKESLDPMKGLIDSSTNNNNPYNSTNTSQQERGFYLPKCTFSQSINRFNILPGYRWDGVDRSTGFERRYLEKINERKDKETEYFKLRTEEM